MNPTDHARNSRSFGLFLFSAGAVFLVLLSIAMILTTPEAMADFRHVFCSARCVLENSDPYNPEVEMRVYHSEGGERPTDSSDARLVVARFIYFPTEFIVTLPFALLPFSISQVLWIAFTASTFIFASFLTWRVCAETAPELAGGMLGFLLANSEQVLLYGNPAGVALSLCVISVMCFLRERFVAAGVLCLVASLAIKPHDSALIWLFFLLARGVYRRRALQTLALFAILALPILMWVTHIAPDWVHEMRSNWAVFTVHGGMNDPGPSSYMHNGSAARVTSLQSVFSVFHDSPRFYNPATYIVVAPLLLLWMAITLRARPKAELAWFALAAIVPISMLPVYHRIYDAKLIMLAIPACAILWAKRDRLGLLAVILTAAACFVSADLTWSAYLHTLFQMRLLTSAHPGVLMSAALEFPLPLTMLAAGVFFLYVYAKQASASLSALPDVEPPAALQTTT